MQFLKADTEVKVVIGPFVAVADGFTPVANFVVGAADEAELMKHDAAYDGVTSISGYTMTAITGADGYYVLVLIAGALDIEGMLTVMFNDDDLCLPVFARFMVVNANVYDSLYGAAAADYLQVDTKQVEGGDATTALETAVDEGLNNAVPETPTEHSINERVKAMDVLTEASGSGDLVAIIGDTHELQQLITSSKIAAQVKAIDDIDLSATMKASVETAVDEALNNAIPGSPLEHSINERIKTLDDHDLVTKIPDVISLAAINAEVDTALNTAVPGSPEAHSINQRIKAVDELTEGSGDGDLAAIKVETDDLHDGERLDLLIDAIKAETDDLAEGERLDLLIDAIKAETDDLAEGERLDLLIDAIKAKTDVTGVPKNVALSNFMFYMVLKSDHLTGATSKTIVEEISKDGASFVACNNAFAEVGSGVYKISLDQAEMNYNNIALKFTESDCDPRIIIIVTSQ